MKYCWLCAALKSEVFTWMPGVTCAVQKNAAWNFLCYDAIITEAQS